MKPKTRIILADCIERGVEYGITRAHKHNDSPTEEQLHIEIERSIWHEIYEFFSFDDEVTE